jgi:hypothetical protein
MFTIVDLLCESKMRVTVSLGANRAMGISPTGLESFDSVLPADAALLHTTPRRTWVIAVMGVYPNQPSLDLGGEAMGFTDVLRPQAGSKAILARVGQKQAFRFLLIHKLSVSRVPKEEVVVVG